MTLGYSGLLRLTGTFFGTVIGGPVLSGGTAVQRDTDRTFLVDVGFALYDPAGANQSIALSLEWSVGTQASPAAWAAATANPYDRLHTAGNPPSLVTVPLAAPAKAFNFVWNAYQDLPRGNFAYVWLRITVVDVAALESQLVVGPFAVTTDVAGSPDPLTAQLTKLAALSRASTDFLGNGLDLPFRRGPRDFVSVSGVDLVRARVRQILGTRAAFGDLFGDLPWRPDFGQKLWTFRHRGNTRTLRARASAFIREALSWERSVRVVGVEIEREPLADPELLMVHVTYEVLLDDFAGTDVETPRFTDTARIAA